MSQTIFHFLKFRIFIYRDCFQHIAKFICHLLHIFLFNGFYHAIYIRMIEPPHFIVDAGDLLAIFGAALIVLIAIEIYTNVTLYLTKDVIHVKLVVATALMAVARKVITLDDKQLEPLYFFAYAALGLAFGITYWLISRRE